MKMHELLFESESVDLNAFIKQHDLGTPLKVYKWSIKTNAYTTHPVSIVVFEKFALVFDALFKKFIGYFTGEMTTARSFFEPNPDQKDVLEKKDFVVSNAGGDVEVRFKSSDRGKFNKFSSTVKPEEIKSMLSDIKQ